MGSQTSIAANSEHSVNARLPDLSEPYRASGKVSHRALVFADEYKQLYEATRQRARSPKNPRYKWESEQLHDYVLSMVNAREAGKKDPDAPEEWESMVMVAGEGLEPP